MVSKSEEDLMTLVLNLHVITYIVGHVLTIGCPIAHERTELTVALTILVSEIHAQRSGIVS